MSNRHLSLISPHDRLAPPRVSFTDQADSAANIVQKINYISILFYRQWKAKPE